MDNLLMSYLSADNESDRQQRLEMLLLVHAVTNEIIALLVPESQAA
jgi:hypothetical protein